MLLECRIAVTLLDNESSQIFMAPRQAPSGEALPQDPKGTGCQRMSNVATFHDEDAKMHFKHGIGILAGWKASRKGHSLKESLSPPTLC